MIFKKLIDIILVFFLSKPQSARATLQGRPFFADIKVRHFYPNRNNSEFDNQLTNEPRQANLCLRAFRHDKL